MDKWFPMNTAPKDGTEILVCEWIGSDRPFVCVAAYLQREGSPLEPGWWGSVASFKNGGELPCRFRDIKISPACWLPLPPPENDATIRRRTAQILRHKYHPTAAGEKAE